MLTTPNADEDLEKLGPSVMAGRNVSGAATPEAVWQFLMKLTCNFHTVEHFTLGHFAREMKTYVHMKTCT